MNNVSLADRLTAFLDRLEAIGNDRKAAWGLCMAEKGVLKRSGYAVTSIRRTITEYRNAIRYRFGDKNPALEYMYLSLSDMEALREDYRARVAEQHTALRPVDCETLVATAVAIVSNSEDQHPMRLAAALLLLTGRRPFAELLANGKLTPGDKRRTLTFDGQAKTGGAETARLEAYAIPVLATPSVVLAAFSVLRRVADCSDITDTPGITTEEISKRVHGRYSKPLNKAVKELFADANGVPLMPKDLRAIYATTAFAWYAPNTSSQNSYFAAVLGHAENDLITGLSYVKFYPTGQKRAFESDLRWSIDAAIVQQYDLLDAEADETKRGYILDKIATLEAIAEGK